MKFIRSWIRYCDPFILLLLLFKLYFLHGVDFWFVLTWLGLVCLGFWIVCNEKERMENTRNMKAFYENIQLIKRKIPKKIIMKMEKCISARCGTEYEMHRKREHTHKQSHKTIYVGRHSNKIPTYLYDDSKRIKRFSLWKLDNDMILRLPTICVSFQLFFFCYFWTATWSLVIAHVF